MAALSILCVCLMTFRCVRYSRSSLKKYFEKLVYLTRLSEYNCQHTAFPLVLHDMTTKKHLPNSRLFTPHELMTTVKFVVDLSPAWNITSCQWDTNQPKYFRFRMLGIDLLLYLEVKESIDSFYQGPGEFAKEYVVVVAKGAAMAIPAKPNVIAIEQDTFLSGAVARAVADTFTALTTDQNDLVQRLS